ncbi:hypothetical protein ACFWYW_20170 [Nonomuraea sp. NPDC059023]
MAEVFFLTSWIIPAIALFLIVYWAVRLAIRHERYRQEGPKV